MKRELLVSAAIRELEMTRIIVAHRPQTAATADRVVTLAGGRIVDEARLAPPPVPRPDAPGDRNISANARVSDTAVPGPGVFNEFNTQP